MATFPVNVIMDVSNFKELDGMADTSNPLTHYTWFDKSCTQGEVQRLKVVLNIYWVDDVVCLSVQVHATFRL